MDVGFDGIIFGLQGVGGVSTYAWELLKRLCVAEGVSVTLGLPSQLPADRATSLATLRAKLRRESVPNKVARYLSSGMPNPVVHSTYYRTSGRPGVRLVITAYDFVYERFASGPAKWVHSAQKRRACEAADVILCISENTRVDLLTIYPRISPSRAVVTPLAVDHETFHAGRSRRSDLVDAVVFIGRRDGYKRFDLAVRSVALAGLRLAVVGDPPSSGECQALDLYLPQRWFSLGRLNNRDLREVYAGAYALIFPSEYEGFGLPVLEAQACGCPTVAANLSCLPEVGGSAALYAGEQAADSYAERLLELSDSVRRAEVIASGLSNAASFNWDRTLELTLNAYAGIS